MILNISENFYKPILGANDGASGVAILLELAKLLNKNNRYSKFI